MLLLITQRLRDSLSPPFFNLPLSPPPLPFSPPPGYPVYSASRALAMSATATLPPQPPLPTHSHSQILARFGSNASPANKRSSDSPHSAISKASSIPAHSPLPGQQTERQSSPPKAGKEPQMMAQMQPKIVGERKPTSPDPVKLPDLALPAGSSPKESAGSPPVAQSARPETHSSNINDSENGSARATEQTPARLALFLSQALADADALRRELALERKRAERAERLVTALQGPSSPNSTNASSETRNLAGRVPESAAKAILEAEARTERAERARDEALHALASLSSGFAELERYEAACALRASDARGAYSRLLTSITGGLPPAQPSPALSTTKSPSGELRLNLPKVPPPLPSLPPVNHLPGTGFNLPPPHNTTYSTRYVRPLPAHSSYGGAQSPTDTRQANTFDSLPLPPPPSASGLGSINSGVPLKRAHSHRVRAEEIEYEEQKRRRLALDTDIDLPTPDLYTHAHRTSRHSNQYQSSPPSVQALSAHPTSSVPFGAAPAPSSRVYDRPLQYGYPPAQPAKETAPPYSAGPSGSRHWGYSDREYDVRDRETTTAGLVRMDARELAREAKARERRERERDTYARHPHSEALESQGATPARRRSASRSSSRSKSSMSLDEMLLETATDGGRGRPTSPDQSPAGLEQRRGQNYGAAQSVNGTGLPSSSVPQPIGRAPSTHGVVVNGIARKSSVPASQLMTLGPTGTIISGGGSDATDGAAVDPAVRFPGLRTCRQCGQPGRYKDGKCVEKWGPGPQGPGTVCDRCRKKMKRVERRGTLDSSSGSLRANNSQSQKSTLPLTHTQSTHVTQSFTQSQSQSQSGRGRALASRTDTLIVEPERHPSDRSHSPGRGSKYHSSVPAVPAAARRPSLSEQAHYSESLHQRHAQQQQPQLHQQHSSRRALTPPYITAISSLEQHSAQASAGANSASRRAESEDELLEEDTHGPTSRSTGSAANLRYAPSESYARQTQGEERDELAEDANGDADADADGSGIGSADADVGADADADIMDAVDASMKAED